MSDFKQVKVDNWGIFFLQRLKHFFNRTDYCDLTLQFQDNAQLKVHRLVLNACTEYFDILERTCEMYEDCLIMPDDLQTDVIVPIINFMYTGQLEYKREMLEKLYQTSQIMNMTVLTKLLDAQRHTKEAIKSVSKDYGSLKRPYTKAFSSSNTNSQPSRKTFIPDKRIHTQVVTQNKPTIKKSKSPPPQAIQCVTSNRFTKSIQNIDKRPTRYSVPEELDNDNIFEESFSNISYDSKPLMVHPETKQYAAKKPNYELFAEASTSSKFDYGSGIDYVECKRISTQNSVFDEDASKYSDFYSMDASTSTTQNKKTNNDSNKLFDMMLENPKVKIETKSITSANSGQLDHAKIISEVLKKYPHLVKSNKNIKLKIINPQSKGQTLKTNVKKQPGKVSIKDEPDYTFESEVMDSQEAARLISLGAENVKGPWICLICGTPGRAMHFTSYYKFRHHLVDVHNEKPILNMCEHCGLKSNRRNYILHHMYTKHGITPPSAYNFPKCNQCNYIGLTEALVVKHKLTHCEQRNFVCNMCFKVFQTSLLLMNHIQTTGHKICADRKALYQCMYCLKNFHRENNLYAHLKTCHKEEAKTDGIIDNSDDEETSYLNIRKPNVKRESPNIVEMGDSDVQSDVQYQIQQQSDGAIQVFTQKSKKLKPKQKILNQEYVSESPKKNKVTRNINNEFNDKMVLQLEQQNTVVSNDIFEIVNDDQFVLTNKQMLQENRDEYIIPEMYEKSNESAQADELTQTPTEFEEAITEDPSNIIIRKTRNMNQPIQIVVSNEEEYKAILNSNPSIIIDENNPNKTLTVLTAPSSSTLNATAINLNNPQNNDMMIIQENFPLNVSEAVSTDSSNIVVVYSHPVDDQSKQYILNTHFGQPQLIASQDIGQQFVESPVITQSYDTITTSTPMIEVTTSEMPIQQPVQTWQTPVQETINENQYELKPNQATLINTTVADTDMSDLPGIQIGTQPENVVPSKEVEITKIEVDVQQIVAPTTENAVDDCITDDIAPHIDTQVEEITAQQETGTEEVPEQEITLEDVETPQTNVLGGNKSNVISIDNTDTEVIKIPITTTIHKNIQRLASEWSDDDDEENKMSAENQTNNSNIEENNDSNTDINALTAPSEVEETIENIQQEMAKQVTVLSVQAPETPEITVTANKSSDTMKEKISSLLNDWDENESQNGENSSQIESMDDGGEEVSETIVETVEEKSEDNHQNDNIKKLVSDWDEDDDENET